MDDGQVLKSSNRFLAEYYVLLAFIFVLNIGFPVFLAYKIDLYKHNHICKPNCTED